MTITSARWFRLLYASRAAFVLILTLAFFENVVVSDAGCIALLVYAPQHAFAVLPLVLGLIAMCKRRFAIVGLNGATLLVWAIWLFGWNVPLQSLKIRNDTAYEVRVMTYNVQRGERGLPGLLDTIAQQRPDILCVQESQDPTPKRFSFPGDALQAHLQGWHHARGGDVMTFSRFPLLSQRVWPLHDERRVLETTWQTPGGKVRVLNVHIAKSDTEKELQERNFTAFGAQIFANARRASRTRLDQLPQIETAIESDQNVPLIVAGDFNSPPRGPFYRALTSHLADAWKQGGWGNQATFPSRWPLFGIDHIFLRGARVKRAFAPRSLASDHLPLVADVVLTPSEEQFGFENFDFQGAKRTQTGVPTGNFSPRGLSFPLAPSIENAAS